MYSLINLWELSEHTLFDSITLPDGIDKEILVNSIFDECGEFEPLTIDVTLMKAKINNFFARNYDNFKRLYNYTLLEYSPIENYNKYRDSTNINDSTLTKGTINTNEFKISAYDSDTYQPNQVETSADSGTDTSKNTTKYDEHEHGNIGTPAITILEKDTNYWNKNNMYQTIAEKFMFTLTISTL